MAKVLFVQNIWREYFGVASLLAVLKEAGHQAGVLIEHDPNRALRGILSAGPDIVAFSFTHCEESYVLRVAEGLKRESPGILTIAGGVHPSLQPDLVESHGLDVLCRGEGEGALPALADRRNLGEDASDIPNLCFFRDGRLRKNPVGPLIEDLDALPFPDREEYYRYDFLRTNPVRFFLTGRGCPYGCSFCFNLSARKMYPNKNRWVRRHSPQRVLAEIQTVLARYPAAFLRFEDDVFTLDAEWLGVFLESYRGKIRRPYMCYIRAGEKEEVIRRLAESGCRTALFGIESGDETRRNRLLAKGVSDQQILETARLLHAHGVHIMTTNILGLPGESFEEALKTLRLNQRAGVKDAWCSIFQPYAGLPLTKRAAREGYLPSETRGGVGINTFTDNALLNPDAHRIANLQKFFHLLVRWPALERAFLPLTKLPPNPFFQMIFVFFYIFSYRKHTGVGLRRLVWEGSKWFRHFLAGGVRQRPCRGDS